MSAQALYRKWRPKSFDEVVGQQHVVRTLRNALTSGRIHHAYLFAGPRGTGKTTTARLLAKAVNCLAPEDERPCNECSICCAINEGRLLDLIEIDAASNTGVDDVRELRERVGFRPNEARYKVYVIDEVHMLSNAAFNALLKTLEEPPDHAIFVLATTEPHKILPTVLSRCQRFDFRRISVGEIVNRLALLAEREGIQIDPDALTLVAQQATGSMRDAESLLDQLASYGVTGITVEDVHTALGTSTDESVIQVTDALSSGDAAWGLQVINSSVDGGADPRQLARQIVEHLRGLLLLRLESGVVSPRISEQMRDQMERQATTFSRRDLTRSVRLFNQAAAEAKGGWQPQLPLEMAFLDAMSAAKSSEVSSCEEKSSVGERDARRSQGAPTTPVKPGQERSSEVSDDSSEPECSSNQPVPSRGTAKDLENEAQESVCEPRSSYQREGGGGESLTVDTLHARWAKVLDALRPRDLSLEALLHDCEPMAVEDDTLVLGFQHKFHRGKVARDNKRRIVEDAVSDLFGQRYKVRCVLLDDEGRGTKITSSSSSVDEESDSSVVEQGIVEDPVVQAAVQDLGARVVR
jgi:DNA polymerase-3 subunit gamma/tau